MTLSGPRVLAQAAEAWLKADETANAQKAIDAAVAMVPDSGELQLTRAKVYAALEKWRDVIDAVNAAEKDGIVSAETYVLRGRAYYVYGDYETAAQEVVNRADPGADQHRGAAAARRPPANWNCDRRLL